MKKSELFRHYNVYSDLAVEAHEILRGESEQEIFGVRMDEEQLNNINVTTITIENEQGAQEIGRPQGQYITIDAPELHKNNYDLHKDITEVLSQKLQKLLNLTDNTSILLVGLGNWNATPDALGPQVIDKTLVTRHLFEYSPTELNGKLRKISAIAPGVLGVTGIETAEIIRGIAEHVKPDLIIAIDALAAGSLDRIGTSIQLTDTGINPGSGIGNKRTQINQDTTGCKVIALGVPTVVNAAVIAHKCLDVLFEQMQKNKTFTKFSTELNCINSQFITRVLDETFSPFKGNLMVTPKEIDSLIKTTARIIAGALGISLHPGIDSEDFERYLQ
ncbi:MAG: GPR endopeptidase [Desulfitobacteriaceae bacterium]|nr:GPR endopeptidase [Desulfitobacteriaceae bacterium]MDD4346313.1 GPR endopeptidase [Desulfitobacteriaceae bacterium]MDD4400551.1 GPR endopeptidase [Desulfitobacteriaceae bacterium]